MKDPAVVIDLPLDLKSIDGSDLSHLLKAMDEVGIDLTIDHRRWHGSTVIRVINPRNSKVSALLPSPRLLRWLAGKIEKAAQ
jgi:hypothetical protein